MSEDYKLHLQVNGNLKLVLKGSLTKLAVEQILGVARSALTFFPMVLVDLREVREAPDANLALLEEGLQQLISEKKLALTCEMPQLRWMVHQPCAPRTACKCGGLCQDCPHRTSEVSHAPKKEARVSGSKRG